MRHVKLLALLAIIAPLASCSSQNSVDSDIPSNDVDVFIFMGQSNMGGRGNPDPSRWPNVVSPISCEEGHAYEFRAITDPTRLYPLSEPFGYGENGGGINDVKGDGGKKTGSLVSAFCESYYETTHTPIIAISASEGGTDSFEWSADNSLLLREAQSRLDDALNFMYSQDDYEVRHINMVWLQGESDAGHFVTDGVDDPSKITPVETYKQNTSKIVDKMQDHGVEKCFLITIGNYIPENSQDNYQRYKYAQKVQEDLCAEDEDIVLASIKFQDMPTTDGIWMHDNNHYFQNGYNIVGNDAGRNVGSYILSGVESECTRYSPADDVINQGR